MKVNVYSLKFNIWFYMLMFVLLALVLVLAIEVLAIRNNNTTLSRYQLQIQTERFAEICKNEDYETLLATESFASDIKLALFQVNGGVLWATDDFYKVDFFKKHQAEILEADDTLSGIDVINGKRTAWHSIRFTQGSGEEVRELYVFATLDVGLNNTTVRSLTAQRIIISLVVFIIAIPSTYIITKRLVMPISNVSRNSKQVADRITDIKFEKSGYTEIDRLSDNLSLTAAQLAETDELKTELISNVSHDIKTPLTLIKSYAEMIRDLSGDNKEKRTEHCNVIISETDRLTALVCDIVDLGKLTSDANQLKLADFDIGECVEETLTSFKSLKDFVFEEDIEKGAIVFADRDKIKQVIYNLIGNAVNYSDERKYVKVAVKKTGNDVRVDVIDHGCGIAKDDLDKVWDRYYRTNRGHKRDIKGTGLGLSIVKTILNVHNARFGVNSTYGEGSDFYFILTRSES